MAKRFPTVIDPYINVDGKQQNSRSLDGCSYDYEFGGFGINRSFSLTATAGSGYVFHHWQFAPEHPFTNISGSNLFAEIHEDFDPYRIVVIAYFVSTTPPPEHDSAIDLRLVGVPPNVGSLIGGGLRTGEVGASVTYSVIAELLEAMKGRYRFIYWLDDQNVRHDSKSFSKAFTFQAGYSQSNPEVKTFTAHFAASTGLILRSSSSGLILRGKANMILRDA